MWIISIWDFQDSSPVGVVVVVVVADDVDGEVEGSMEKISAATKGDWSFPLSLNNSYPMSQNWGSMSLPWSWGEGIPAAERTRMSWPKQQPRSSSLVDGEERSLSSTRG